VEKDDDLVSAAKTKRSAAPTRSSASKRGVASKRSAVASHNIALQEAVEFIWLEADLLDARDYDPWLALWTPTGHYVIPIEREGDDHAAQLNIVYDDHALREARVRRLRGDLSVAASPSARTTRTVSRFRQISDAKDCVIVRAAQHLIEYKYDRIRILAADVTYRLVRFRTSMALDRKVVRLINSDEALFGISYLL
jgi:3-phenylpropionate/cinnamic acid dioxygenase small subunit